MIPCENKETGTQSNYSQPSVSGDAEPWILGRGELTVRDVLIHGFWYPQGVPEPIPSGYQGMTVAQPCKYLECLISSTPVNGRAGAPAFSQ